MLRKSRSFALIFFLAALAGCSTPLTTRERERESEHRAALLVLSYRSQFANVLNKSSYADLIQLIRSKLQ